MGLNILITFTSDMQEENDLKIELIKSKEHNMALEKVIESNGIKINEIEKK